MEISACKVLLIVTALLMGQFLTACSPSPESYGREVAEKRCECSRLHTKLLTNGARQFIEAARAKKFSTREEAWKAKGSMSKWSNYPGDSIALRTCRKDLTQMEEGVALKFIQQEDRVTYRNAYSAYVAACQKPIDEEDDAYHVLLREGNELIEALPPR